MEIIGEYYIMRYSMNLESVITYEETHDINMVTTGVNITGIPLSNKILNFVAFESLRQQNLIKQ